MMDCLILIPAKGFVAPKQRLSSVLDLAERSRLAAAMLDDVLTALATWRKRPDVAVVTGDSAAKEMALGRGFKVIEDHECAGETDAIAAATSVAIGWGAASTMVIPADMPLVIADELAAVLNALPAPPAPGSVLVPAADGRGTNAVLRRPADLFPLHFGNDSFQPHWRAAQSTGCLCRVLKLPGIGLDIDGPADLAALLHEPVRTESQRLLLSWNVSERLAALSGASAINAAAIS